MNEIYDKADEPLIELVTDPNTSPIVLDNFSKNSDCKILCLIAENPNTSSETLDYLASRDIPNINIYPDIMTYWNIMRSICRNRNASQLNRSCRYKYSHMLGGPGVTRNQDYTLELAQSKFTSTKILDNLCEGTNHYYYTYVDDGYFLGYNLVLALVENPNTSSKGLSKIRFGKSEVEHALAKNINTPLETLLRLVNDWSSTGRDHPTYLRYLKLKLFH